MKNTLTILFMIALLWSCEETPEAVKTADHFYETELFKAVQLSEMFPDSKTFVDYRPKESFEILEERYLMERENKDFSLESFVRENFERFPDLPNLAASDTLSDMYAHIERMWPKLRKEADKKEAHSSKIPLPNPYIVPGGRFREIYYWDSYFTLEGLLVSGRYDLAESMVENFAYLIDSLGFIPNGTRDYYLSRSQPPFFSLMVDAISRENATQRVRFLPQMLAEYSFWMQKDSVTEQWGSSEASRYRVDLTDGFTLNRYWDSGTTPRPESFREDMELAETVRETGQKVQLYKDLRAAACSGWDFSSRWYGTKGKFSTTKTTRILPVDLNSLLYFMELQISRAYGDQTKTGLAEEFKAKAEKRKEAIQKYMWSEEGFYLDYDFEDQHSMPEWTLAAVYPLYFEIATVEQAQKVREVLFKQFLMPGGLRTTLDHSGQQWDAPNGWAPLQWMAVHGLLNYGYTDDASLIAERWLEINEKVYGNTGKMMEKYNVEDLSLLSGGGEYPTQDGFGWTNGVAVGFKRLMEQSSQNP